MNYSKYQSLFYETERKAIPFLRVIFPCYVLMIIVLSFISLGESLPSHDFDKFAHFAAYAVMAILGMPLVKGNSAVLLMVTGICLLGALLEVAQSFNPIREASLLDFCANTLGAFFAAAFYFFSKQKHA